MVKNNNKNEPTLYRKTTEDLLRTLTTKWQVSRAHPRNWFTHMFTEDTDYITGRYKDPIRSYTDLYVYYRGGYRPHHSGQQQCIDSFGTDL